MTTTAQPAPERNLSFKDTLNSLTGYEENAIEERFEESVSNLLDNATKSGRALLYIIRCRAGLKPAAAFKSVMEMRLSEVNEAFKSEDDDEDDFDPDDPDTEQGKGDSFDG